MARRSSSLYSTLPNRDRCYTTQSLLFGVGISRLVTTYADGGIVKVRYKLHDQ
jgi:hypothetical protein